MGRSRLTDEEKEASKQRRKEWLKKYWREYYKTHKKERNGYNKACCSKSHACTKCGNMTEEGSISWYCLDCVRKYRDEWLLGNPDRKCACGNPIMPGKKMTRCQDCSNKYQRARNARIKAEKAQQEVK
jgi:hypothetical protein